MIRIWPRKSGHDVQTTIKRRIDEHDVTSNNVTSSPLTSSQSSRANRYTKGGSLDSRYSGDTAKSYPHLVRNIYRQSPIFSSITKTSFWPISCKYWKSSSTTDYTSLHLHNHNPLRQTKNQQLSNCLKTLKTWCTNLFHFLS